MGVCLCVIAGIQGGGLQGGVVLLLAQSSAAQDGHHTQQPSSDLHQTGAVPGRHQ